MPLVRYLNETFIGRSRRPRTVMPSSKLGPTPSARRPRPRRSSPIFDSHDALDPILARLLALEERHSPPAVPPPRTALWSLVIVEPDGIADLQPRVGSARQPGLPRRSVRAPHRRAGRRYPRSARRTPASARRRPRIDRLAAMPMSPLNGATPVPVDDQRVGNNRVEQQAVVHGQRLVARRVGTIDVAGRKRVERGQQTDEVRRAPACDRDRAGKRPGLDQHDAGAPLRQVVAERPDLELVIVAADPTWNERLERRRGGRRRPSSREPARVVAARLVERDCQQRDRRRTAGLSDRRAPVLVVKIEADRRFSRSRSFLSAGPRVTAAAARRG